jgi:hypothetical protein
LNHCALQKNSRGQGKISKNEKNFVNFWGVPAREKYPKMKRTSLTFGESLQRKKQTENTSTSTVQARKTEQTLRCRASGCATSDLIKMNQFSSTRPGKLEENFLGIQRREFFSNAY